MRHEMPTLLYAPDALAPHISAETMKFHYGKHLQTYVDNLNKLIEGTLYEDMELEEIVCKASGSVFNNAAQVWNHTFFFNSLTPEPQAIPAELEFAITRDFGSVEEFKAKFKKSATDIFGSGWAWLAQDNSGKLHIIQESNAGNPMRAGYKPLLTIDVWEHAYYIDYRNRRAEFVDRCWSLINWKKVAQRMHEDLLTAIITDMAETKTDGSSEETVIIIAEEIQEDTAENDDMAKYICIPCGWIYDPAEGDPDSGIPAGTPFKDIPDDWTCPACGVDKEYFEKYAPGPQA